MVESHWAKTLKETQNMHADEKRTCDLEICFPEVTWLKPHGDQDRVLPISGHRRLLQLLDQHSGQLVRQAVQLKSML
jgi:hypothetical protein